MGQFRLTFNSCWTDTAIISTAPYDTFVAELAMYVSDLETFSTLWCMSSTEGWSCRRDGTLTTRVLSFLPPASSSFKQSFDCQNDCFVPDLCGVTFLALFSFAGFFLSMLLTPFLIYFSSSFVATMGIQTARKLLRPTGSRFSSAGLDATGWYRSQFGCVAFSGSFYS